MLPINKNLIPNCKKKSINVKDEIPKASASYELITLKVNNCTSFVVENFDLLNANEYLGNDKYNNNWNADGSFTLNGVAISANFGNISSYRELLQSLGKNEFLAGSIYLENLNGSKQQVKDVFKLTTIDVTGELNTRGIKPFKEVFQVNENISYSVLSFNIGLFTTLTWPILYPCTTFQISIFPSSLIDPSLALNSQLLASEYNRPHILQSLRGGGH